MSCWQPCAGGGSCLAAGRTCVLLKYSSHLARTCVLITCMPDLSRRQVTARCSAADAGWANGAWSVPHASGSCLAESTAGTTTLPTAPQANPPRPLKINFKPRHRGNGPCAIPPSATGWRQFASPGDRWLIAVRLAMGYP
jgi:hypothetical protein